MVKIKQKKTMNLPQLIEWGFENDVTGAMFSDDRVEAKRIRFEVGMLVSIHGDMNKEDTFTVKVEEEITEDTVVDLIERFIGGMGNVCYTSHKMSINKSLRTSPSDITTTHFYIENDNRELVLIWCDGKLVE
ncbi:hypothetical protein NGC89_02960 [Staphylococcus xylosus]|uniref:hypothetical protein n=1 Tax=Staphylococcus xylosus TaxID=1288 RepID=UPI002DBAC146|nr:hypothetical protein [Staphylococcus xylosus]MEB7800427.1 hypothetical protein [Staphylococcus xylosus]